MRVDRPNPFQSAGLTHVIDIRTVLASHFFTDPLHFALLIDHSIYPSLACSLSTTYARQLTPPTPLLHTVPF